MGKAQDQIDSALQLFFEDLEEDGLKLLAQDGGLYLYKNGAWRLLGKDEERDLFNKHIYECCSNVGCDYATRMSPLWAQIYTNSTPSKRVQFDKLPIVALPNGSLELGNREFMEWSPKHHTTRRLAIEYDPAADCPQWEGMLDRMLESTHRTKKQRAEMKTFLQQWVGINFVGPAAKGRSRSLRTGIIIDGPSRSGKTTFSNVVKELFGHEKGAVVSPSIDDLSGQFGKVPLLNAQALITDDGISTTSKVDAKVMKAIVTGEPMVVDRKFQSPIADFSYSGAVLFTTNTLPNIADETDAIYNRLRVVRMDRVFSKEDAKRDFGRDGEAIPFLKKKGEFPGILNWALDGFTKAWDQGFFDLPTEMNDAARMFRMRNDPVYGFLNEAIEADDDMVVPANVMTALFTEYALENYHTKIPAKRAVNALVRNVKDVIPTVQYENPNGGQQVLTYVGVRLSKIGLASWMRVKEKNLASVDGVLKPHSRRA